MINTDQLVNAAISSSFWPYSQTSFFQPSFYSCVTVCVSWDPLRNQHKDDIRSTRVLLRMSSVNNKGQREQESARRALNHDAGLIHMNREGKDEQIKKTLDCIQLQESFGQSDVKFQHKDCPLINSALGRNTSILAHLQCLSIGWELSGKVWPQLL